MADHDRPAQRDVRARIEDHAAIGRLAEELLPSLIAKLGATGLGEIEVREDDWRVRLRRPADPTVRHDRRSTDRPSRAQPGHLGHGHAPAAVEGHRGARGGMAPVGPGTPDEAGPGAGSGERLEDRRAVATSPAVGVFQPRPDVSAGTKVRAGDRLGFVDLLGVPQEVVAPVDGIVGASLVEAGEAVEYGQALIRVELAWPPSRKTDGLGAPVAAGDA
jgi:acetyl-CoA carboxylase biotin carboxyl carrier protein